MRSSWLWLFCLLSLSQFRLGNSGDFRKVKIVKSDYDAPGFERALTDDDLASFYKANLEPDMAYWRGLVQRRGKRFTSRDLVKQANVMLAHKYVCVLVVKDGEVHLFRASSLMKFGTNRMLALQARLRELHGNGTRVPNTILIFNPLDEPICEQVKSCQVPVFTLFKRVLPPTAPASSPAAAAGPHGPELAEDREIVLPSFSQSYNTLYLYPWQDKTDAALLRASMQGSMSENCTRYQLTVLSARDSETAGMLDAGIVWNRNKVVDVPDSQRKRFVGPAKHAFWRFLLNTDGHTASSRLGHLLGVNSVVLKERSPWIEHYYRSLTEGKEYFSFDLGDILNLLKELRVPERSAELQRVATAGQQFAYRYLHTPARVMYTRQAIIQYNELFEDMGGFVDSLQLKDTNGSISGLIRALAAKVGGRGH